MKTGTVAKSTGLRYEVFGEDGTVYSCYIKGKFRIEGMKATNPIAVGDKVDFLLDPVTGEGVIRKLHDRTNYIIRRSNKLSKQYHILASNVDQAFVFATIIQPRTSQGFIDRFLVTAEAYDIQPHIIFNKMDIYGEKEMNRLEDMKFVYEHIGYPVHTISVKKRAGVFELEKFMKGKVSLLMGHSGSGKTSFLNMLNPLLKLKTQEISSFSSKGKHTTTFAEMHFLKDDLVVIDTPGIKEFGLVDIKPEELSHFFPEMRELLQNCRFNNCLHINEPGCAVIEALEEGKLPPERYGSYLSILEDDQGVRRRR
jgi:ribosome biogenesis GTPase / thiamine phosphate phosphatase